jgi:hypothetical protein
MGQSDETVNQSLKKYQGVNNVEIVFKERSFLLGWNPGETSLKL